jgi:hypothetical protein
MQWCSLQLRVPIFGGEKNVGFAQNLGVLTMSARRSTEAISQRTQIRLNNIIERNEYDTEKSPFHMPDKYRKGDFLCDVTINILRCMADAEAGLRHFFRRNPDTFSQPGPEPPTGGYASPTAA